jgi:hypothetical protein
VGEFYVRARANFEVRERHTVRFVGGDYYQVDYVDDKSISVANGVAGATFSPEELDDRFERHEGCYLSLFTKRPIFRHASGWTYEYIQRWCRYQDASERKWRAAIARALAEMFVAAHNLQPHSPCPKWALELHSDGAPGKLLLRVAEILELDPESVLEKHSSISMSLTFEDDKNISWSGTVKTSGTSAI